MGLFSTLFGKKAKIDFAELKRNGAIILDVRTPSEYQGGHIKGSVNIPLDKIQTNLKKLKSGATIITCCASGMRSSSAAAILRKSGFDAHNGGSWLSLKNKL
jgi:phage shock protein E